MRQLARNAQIVQETFEIDYFSIRICKSFRRGTQWRDDVITINLKTITNILRY